VKNHIEQISRINRKEDNCTYIFIELIYRKLLFFYRFDDIQDGSILREDFPVAHSIYGLCNTLNAANYAQFIAFEKIINLHPMVSNCIVFIKK